MAAVPPIYLNISKNAFTELPPAVCKLGDLIELRASDNRLSSLRFALARGRTGQQGLDC